MQSDVSRKAVAAETHTVRAHGEARPKISHKSFLEKEADNFHNEVKVVKEAANDIRQTAIHNTPSFIINNSVSLISLAHVGSEILMLKSGGLQFNKNNRDGGKPNLLIDPAYNLVRGLLGKDKEKNGKAAQNPWLIRSTAMGFFTWVLGSVSPTKKDTDSEVFNDSKTFAESKTEYFANRVGEALSIWKPEYKRQQIGLGVTLAGTFSTLSGFNNIDGGGKYYWNKSRSLGGLVTAAAGSALWLSVTDRDAWGRFGSMLWFRLPFIGTSINKMYNKTMQYRGQSEPEAIKLFEKANKEWKYYAGGAAGFQAAAMASFLIGGAEVKPDGSIITHDAAKVAGKVDGVRNKLKMNDRDDSMEVAEGTPHATITSVVAEGRATAPAEEKIKS